MSDSTLGLRINTKLAALSQYAGYNFNSLCNFNGVILGASTTGIFSFGGKTFNTAPITAWFETNSYDHNDLHNKQVRTVTLSGVFAKMAVTTILDGIHTTEYTTPGDATVRAKTVDVPINHSDMGKYIGVKVANVNGSDFSIDGIGLLLGVTEKMKFYDAEMGRLKATLPALTISAED